VAEFELVSNQFCVYVQVSRRKWNNNPLPQGCHSIQKAVKAVVVSHGALFSAEEV